MISYDKLKEILDAAPICNPERKKNKGVVKDYMHKKILDRDNYMCVICKNKNHIIIHHKDPYGPATLENLVALCLDCHENIHKILRKKGYKYYYIRENIPKRLPNYISKNEVSKILYNAKKHNKRNYLMLLILWRAGIRVSEVVKLEKRDICEDTIFIRLGKGKKDRIIPLESELNNILGFYTDGLKPNDKLFNISERQIRNIINKYTPEGIKASLHTFRHSFAVYCLKNGMNLRSLQKILGHTNLTTTQVYLDIVGEDIKDDYDKINW